MGVESVAGALSGVERALESPRTGFAQESADVSNVAKADPQGVDTKINQSERQAFDQAVIQLSEVLGFLTSDLRISVDQDLGRPIVKVIDTQSDEVIRQIPSEEMVALMKRLRELSEVASGGNFEGLILRGEI